MNVPQIDWASPITKGLVFCAVPVGSTFLDLVTGVFATPTAPQPSVQPLNGGYAGGAQIARVLGATADGGDNGFVWPQSSTLRGAQIVETGTILALTGFSQRVTNQVYGVCGFEDPVNHHGATLAIDSEWDADYGGILRMEWNAVKVPFGNTSAGAIGTSFENKLHLFGFTYSGQGAAGHWLYRGGSVAWSGGATFGATTTDRRAYVSRLNYTGSTVYRAGVARVAYSMFWNRRISVGEYAALYRNPWRVFANGALRTYSVPYAPTAAYTIHTETADDALLTADSYGREMQLARSLDDALLTSDDYMREMLVERSLDDSLVADDSAVPVYIPYGEPMSLHTRIFRRTISRT